MLERSGSNVDVQIVVFEREFWLTPELQRQFHEDTRSQVQYVSNLNSIRGVFNEENSYELEILILDFKNAAAECLNYLSDIEKNRFRSRRMIVALVDHQMQSLEWRLREAGCTSVHFHPFGGEEITDTIRSASHSIFNAPVTTGK